MSFVYYAVCTCGWHPPCARLEVKVIILKVLVASSSAVLHLRSFFRHNATLGIGKGKSITLLEKHKIFCRSIKA
eukprot:scaffold26763_cov116-Isochrysis_galbana.AAC.5